MISITAINMGTIVGSAVGSCDGGVPCVGHRGDIYGCARSVRNNLAAFGRGRDAIQIVSIGNGGSNVTWPVATTNGVVLSSAASCERTNKEAVR